MEETGTKETPVKVTGNVTLPLANCVVLRRIFKYDKSPNAILRNRLVSKIWLGASAADWQRLDKQPVLLYAAGNPAENRQERRHITLSEFHVRYQHGDPVVEGMVSRPPAGATLHQWKKYVGDANLEESTLDRWFWSWTATVNLTRLTLVDCHFHDKIRVFDEPFLRSLPALREFTLKDCVVYPSALATINEAHNLWAEEQKRKTRRRELTATSLLPAWEPIREGDGDEKRYEHTELRSLDVTLKLEGETGKPLFIWGPLLAKVPRLTSLRVGGVYDTHVPAFPPLDDASWAETVCALNAYVWVLVDFGGMFPLEQKGTRIIHKRRDCTCGNFSTARPSNVGNYFELLFENAIQQVGRSLRSLDLLDFAGSAQENGSLSASSLMESNPYPRPEWEDRIHPITPPWTFSLYPGFERVALDIGVDAVYAERDLATLEFGGFTPEVMRHLTLYRAPLAPEFPRSALFYVELVTLELWGNVCRSLEPFRWVKTLERLYWITTCYDVEHRGKRLRHLLTPGRATYPLFTQDLVENTRDEKFPPKFDHLRHLEMDWSVLSLKSWRKLAQWACNLETLNAVVADDQQLGLVAELWPKLQSLHLNHRSRVSASGLKHVLPTIHGLKQFKWEGCACTLHLFQRVEQLREVEAALNSKIPDTELTLPWSWTALGDLVSHDTCYRGEFEAILLEAAL